MDGGELSQHRHTARCNFRVTYRNFLSRALFYNHQ